MGKRERMSSVDTAWLRMDSPANLMMIVGIYEFEGPLDLARLRDLVANRFAKHSRMRSRVVQDATGKRMTISTSITTWCGSRYPARAARKT